MKKFNCVLVAIVFTLIIFNFSFAAVSGAEIYEEFTKPPSGVTSTKAVTQTILGVLSYFGYAAAAVLILYTGIGYLTSTPATKAKLKERLWLIITGVVMLAGLIPMLNFVTNLFYDFGQDL